MDIGSNASALDIKKAFRKLALQYHPDIIKSENTQSKTYQEIYEAYTVLSNPKAKKQYDLDLFIYQNTKGYTHTSLSDLYIALIKLYYIEYNQNLKHVNQQKLSYELLQIFHPQNIDLLNTQIAHPEANSIFKYLLRIVRNLNYKELVLVKSQISDLRIPPAFQLILNKYEVNKRIEYKWLIWRPIFGLTVAILLCLLIYFLSH